MRKLIVPEIAALMTLSLASPRFIRANPVDELLLGEHKEPANVEAHKTTELNRLRILTGEVLSVDHAARTVTVEKEGLLLRSPVTFAVPEEVVSQLTDLHRGVWVDVTYTEVEGELIAQAIVKTQPYWTEKAGER